MKENTPRSIRTIGIVLAVVSILVVLSNIGGFFMIDYLTEGRTNTEEIPYYAQSVDYAKPIAMVSSALALGFLVAGIFITRYKNWARVLAQIVAVFYLLLFWYQSVFIAPYNPFDKGEFGVEQLIGMLIWSVPVAFLIVYLNREEIKNHFA
jgi:hypothetical protein